MSSSASTTPAEPKLRADAARNRALLLGTARDAFTAADDDRSVSLEGIARAAGVGIGTLYRHFPTREALVEALYRSELDEVVDSADALFDGRTAFQSLRAWMDRYTRFVATKQGMSSALRAAWAAGSIPMGETKSRIVAVMARFLDAGAVDGSIRADVTADDVTDMLVGVFLATGNAKDAARVARLLDVLADGLRPRRA
jgi:AcrR family transcriptional regulator